MKKYLLGAALTAAAGMGTAHAAITLIGGKPVIDPADTYQIFLSGASAQRVFLEQLMLDSTVPAANKICSGTVYKFSDDTGGSNQNAYLCVGNLANPALAPLLAGAKKNILLYKRSSGGSIMGITPVINEALTSANIAFLRVSPTSPTTTVGQPTTSGVTPCTTVTATTFTCPYVEGTSASHVSSTWTKPDFGSSDVDPLRFNGTNLPTGFPPVTAAGVAQLQVRHAFSQNFGIVVNDIFYAALQQAQGKVVGNFTAAQMPSLTTGEVKNILTGALPASLTSVIPAGQSLHVCGRTNGSGTKAATAVAFMNYTCVAGAQSPKADTGATLDDFTSGVNVLVHQMSSSGDLEECLAELNAGSNTVGTKFNNIWTTTLAGKTTRFALGYQGTENNADPLAHKPYRFIKINGFQPTLTNVYNNNYVTGALKYTDWLDATFQYNKSATSHLINAANPLFVSGKLEIINEMIKEAGNPVVVKALNIPQATHTWGQAGFMGSKLFWPPASIAKPVNQWVHKVGVAPNVTINNCAKPTL